MYIYLFSSVNNFCLFICWKGIRNQIRGTGMILQLCRNVVNLEQLIQNQTIMQALTRVLQDEHKKSIDLTFNILRYLFFHSFLNLFMIIMLMQICRIFLAFSNFTEMHNLMANYRIGLLTMKVKMFILYIY